MLHHFYEKTLTFINNEGQVHFSKMGKNPFLNHFINFKCIHVVEIIISEPVANITTDADPEAKYHSVEFSLSGITIAQVEEVIKISTYIKFDMY
mgnify:CR=1 FL=1